MDSDNPLVSVIIPAYNAQETIYATIQSVINQTFADWELIIVDDGSTDGTSNIIQQINDDRIIYIYQENKERAVARNRGIAAATGQFLAFLDADDQWLEEKLERQLSRFEKNPNTGMVYCDLYYFDGQTNRNLAQYSKEYFKLHRGFVLPHLLRVCFIQSPTPVIRHSILEHMDWFDPDLTPAEDWDLWLRVSGRYYIDYIPEPLARYRFHGYLEYWKRSPDALLEKTLRMINKLAILYPEEYRRFNSSFRRARSLAYYNYGLALMLNNKSVLAFKGFHRALEIDPTFFKIYVRMIQTQFIRIHQEVFRNRSDSQRTK